MKRIFLLLLATGILLSGGTALATTILTFSGTAEGDLQSLGIKENSALFQSEVRFSKHQSSWDVYVNVTIDDKYIFYGATIDELLSIQENYIWGSCHTTFGNIFPDGTEPSLSFTFYGHEIISGNEFRKQNIDNFSFRIIDCLSNGNLYTITGASSIPEPSTILLLGAGLLGLTGVIRRKKHR